ncbi:SCO family protein [Maribacter sp.]|uniref:SCO family protein n=1 Tax=Maribacter sp. TaxID=1897614 RepID=UPI0025BB2C32|nr:SCO family protein [Maribacter sp.]
MNKKKLLIGITLPVIFLIYFFISEKNYFQNNELFDVSFKDNKLSYIKLNGEKQKVPFFNFINQDGVYISNTDYNGKVYVIEFFYTTCPTICPLMSKNLVNIQDAFLDYDNFGIASFSIASTFDTPDILNKYAEAYGVVDKDWNLMTGNLTDIYELANSGFNLYVEQVPEVPGGIEHSGYFALIDKEGYLRSRLDNFGNPIIYYLGTVSEAERFNRDGNKEQISILKEDIKLLLEE